MNNEFKDKTLLITGGTGSFGNAVVRRFLDSDIKEIRIFSRDEKKQEDMRHAMDSPKLKFYIGDVRDPNSIGNAMRGVDYVFSAAALKQVPSCEFHPMEAVAKPPFSPSPISTTTSSGAPRKKQIPSKAGVYASPSEALHSPSITPTSSMAGSARHSRLPTPRWLS